MKIVGSLFLLFVLGSCLKEEIPVPKAERGEGNVVAISIGSEYTKQVHFNLEENKIISTNDKFVWDIGFATGNGETHVISNVAKYVFVYRTDKNDLTEVTSKFGYTNTHYFDVASGNIDSTGIGDWTDGKVRLLDMGTLSDGTQLGWYKIKITKATSTTYFFEYAPLQSTEITYASIQKQEDCNYVYYSLLHNKQVKVEPGKEEWDVVFTQYIEHLTSPLVMDYLLTGCLLNPHQTKALQLTNKPYDEIDLAYALSLNLSSAKNAIGYDWKDIGLEQVMEGGTANYTIFPNKTYVIKDQKGNYFKLKFLDFYSKTGEKGTPTFQYMKLND